MSNLPRGPWEVLVVDDDPSVVRLSQAVLGTVTLDGRPVEVLTARSADEAWRVLEAHPSVAVAVIDVIMETPTAGLDLAERIRRHPGLRATRIAIHSGQAAALHGQSLEQQYEIHDRWSKTDARPKEMRARLRFLLRAHQDILDARGPLPAPPEEPHGSTPARLHTLVYTSELRRHMTDTELSELAAASQARNETSGITGVLFVDGTAVVQLMEGPREAVQQTFERIEADPRHTHIERLHESPAAHRSFPGWRMELVRIPSGVKGPSRHLVELIRRYAQGLRPTPADFAQMLLALYTDTRPAPPLEADP